MLTEKLKLMGIEQSAKQIQFAIDNLEGVMNSLLADSSANHRSYGTRLQKIHSQIGQELKNIGYIVQQGQVPVAQDQLEIGQKVQEAVNKISQL